MICQEACQLLSGDLGSAEPDHPGRLPGFLNLKPKYQSKDGSYPTVLLHHAIDQFTSFSLSGRKAGGGVSPLLQITKVVHNAKDRSREDFALACQMIKQDKSDDQIRLFLSQREKGRDRPNYVTITIRKARLAVESG